MKQKQLRHKQYEDFKQYATAKDREGYHLPILLYGEAGTSKSKAAELLAQDLGVRFGYLPMSQQTTKSDLLGYLTPNGDNQISLFGDFYEHGGVFVLEEVDAANMNVLLSLNAAIASTKGYFAGKMVNKSKDFILIMTANTVNGLDENYSARQKFDSSTLTRAIKLEWGFDADLEAGLIDNLRVTNNINIVRKKLHEYGIILSMREALLYSNLLSCGINEKQAADSTILFNLEKSLREEFYDILSKPETVTSNSEDDEIVIVTEESYAGFMQEN